MSPAETLSTALLLVVFALLGPPAAAYDLTGLWKDESGLATYRLRQIGDWVYWGVDGTPMGSFANLSYGQIRGDLLETQWVDLPGSPALSGGTLRLRIESNDRLVKIGSSGWYGAATWTRVGSSPAPAPQPQPQPQAGSDGTWSEWLNDDAPDGTGDHEVKDFPISGVPCAHPDAVECRVIADRRDWRTAGQRMVCSMENPNRGGGRCLNADNPPGGCLDYQVRFHCPSGGVTAASEAQSRTLPLDMSVDWTTSATGTGQIRNLGARLRASCPSGGAAHDIWGTDLYASDSSICTAAVHAGLIDFGGGEVTIEIRPGADSYTSTTRHGVASGSYGAWDASFAFVGGSPRAAESPRPPASVEGGTWTPWISRDEPSGGADWEALAELRGEGRIRCDTALAIECRTRDGRDWQQAGQRYTCSLDEPTPGGICVNADNGGACLDYEVRLLCR